MIVKTTQNLYCLWINEELNQVESTEESKLYFLKCELEKLKSAIENTLQSYEKVTDEELRRLNKEHAEVVLKDLYK